MRFRPEVIEYYGLISGGQDPTIANKLSFDDWGATIYATKLNYSNQVAKLTF